MMDEERRLMEMAVTAPTVTPALAVQADGLLKRYAGASGDTSGQLALAGVSLAVRAGEIYGLLGPNGAGKSTAIQVLTTLLAPTAGFARIFGHDLVEEQGAVRHLIGVALQETGVDPLLTGREALYLQARLYGASRAAARQRTQELAEQFDLTPFLSRRIGQYSGGMRRRLDLAVAVAHQPRVVFLDEPTTGLDLPSRTGLWQLLRRIRAETGTTIFLTTQYLEEADALCDRIGILRAGQLVAEDAPGQLKRRLQRDVVELEVRDEEQVAKVVAWVHQQDWAPSVDRRRVRWTAANGAEAAGRTLAAMGDAKIQLTGFSVTPPTLDDVFFALTQGNPAVPAADQGDAAGGMTSEREVRRYDHG